MHERFITAEDGDGMVVRVGRCPGGSTVGTTGVTSEHRCLVAVLKVVLKSGGRLRVGHRKRERLTGLREKRTVRIRQTGGFGFGSFCRCKKTVEAGGFVFLIGGIIFSGHISV